MQVIIAEKPSVAREIAAIVGATNRKDGFIEGNGYAVTWAFGHLVGLAMPQQYGIAGFRRENLPILPSSFILLPRQVREGKEYKADPGVVKQLGILRELFGMAERIIVATDAGREGELIFRYIYSYLECRTPFVRLWISSLTDRAIREGLQHLRPGNEYDNLYLSAKARSEADWIVGINASQALAVAAGRGVWSLGRVQTPTLAIICSRYLENKAFKPATYFRLKLSTAKEGTEFTVLSTEKFDGREKAEAARAEVIGARTVRVVNVERKEATSVGNGRLDAVANAIQSATGMDFHLENYSEHSLDEGSTSRAASYVGLVWGDNTVTWGAGTDTDIIVAGIRALVSAINNR